MMAPTRLLRLRRLVLGAALLAATVLGAAPPTQAASGACSSEPVAILSNGYTLDIDTIVRDNSSDVSLVQYQLTLPAGVSVSGWADTAALGPKDTYSVSNTNAAGNYSVGVDVQTNTPAIAVAAQTALLKASGGAVLSRDSTTGISKQQLWLRVAGS